MTKMQARFLENYRRATATELCHVYKSFSSAKTSAWVYCKNLCKELNGWGMKICSHNAQIFTVGFLFMKDGKEHLCYITPNHGYKFPVE